MIAIVLEDRRRITHALRATERKKRPDKVTRQAARKEWAVKEWQGDITDRIQDK